MYCEDTGEVLLNGLKQPLLRMGNNVPPCRMRGPGGGCVKGTPEDQRNHTPQNMLAYDHWKQCKATNDWPRNAEGEIDPIVKRNAAILEEAEADYTRQQWDSFRIAALQILNGAIAT